VNVLDSRTTPPVARLLFNHLQPEGLLMNDALIEEWLRDLATHLRQIPPGGGRYANGRPSFIAALAPQEWRLLNLHGMADTYAPIVAEAWEQDHARFRSLLVAYVRIRTLTGLANAPFIARWSFTDPLMALAAGDEETYRIQVPVADDWGDPELSFSVDKMVLLVTRLIAAIEHGLSWPPAWETFAGKMVAGNGAFDRALAETLLALRTGDGDPVTPFGKVVATFRRPGWARTRYGALAGLPLLPVGIVQLARRKNHAAAEVLAAMLPATAFAYRRTLGMGTPACAFLFPAELDFLNALLANPASWAALAAQLASKWNATA
jgi:hypothetical protein